MIPINVALGSTLQVSHERIECLKGCRIAGEPWRNLAPAAWKTGCNKYVWGWVAPGNAVDTVTVLGEPWRNEEGEEYGCGVTPGNPPFLPCEDR